MVKFWTNSLTYLWLLSSSPLSVRSSFEMVLLNLDVSESIILLLRSTWSDWGNVEFRFDGGCFLTLFRFLLLANGTGLLSTIFVGVALGLADFWCCIDRCCFLLFCSNLFLVVIILIVKFTNSTVVVAPLEIQTDGFPNATLSSKPKLPAHFLVKFGLFLSKIDGFQNPLF